MNPPPRFSIIIPALDEEAQIASAIEHLRADHDREVIVVDGGSRDRTRERASASGAQVKEGRRGRAEQMNHGAAGATGDLLAFLHADTRIPEGGLEEASLALEDETVSLVAFALWIDHPAPAFRIIESAANLRSKALGLPYGDQVLCVRRETFDALGGFRAERLLEDVDFVRRARTKGRVHILSHRAPTSPRRWLRRGVLRTSLMHQLLLATHTMRVPPRWLGRGGRDPSGGPTREGPR